MSPGSAKTTSSIVKYLSTLRIAKPTLLVIVWPLAIVKTKSFFSRFTPIFSSVRDGIHVYSLPVSTKARGTVIACLRPV